MGKQHSRQRYVIGDSPIHVIKLLYLQTDQRNFYILSFMLVPAFEVSSAALFVRSCKCFKSSAPPLAARSARTASSLSDASSGFQ